MNVTHHSATEDFDAETLALQEAVEVQLPEFTDLDLDAAFGTPLDEPASTRRKMRAYVAAVVAAAPSQSHELSLSHSAEIQARVDAARDIVADDPTISARVREYLVDALLPYAAQLRTALPTAAPLPSTA